MLKSIRYGALALALALSVGGCSERLQKFESFVGVVSKAEVPADAVIVARVAFNSAQAVATNYLQLRRCTGNNGPICRDPALTVRIGNAIRAGRNARNELTQLMRANPGGSVPVVSYDTMVAATNIINNLTASYQAARGG